MSAVKMSRPYHEPFQSSLKQLVRHAHPTGMLDWRKRALNDVFDVQIRPDLIEHSPHAPNACVCQHHKLEVRRRLEVVELIFASSV